MQLLLTHRENSCAPCARAEDLHSAPGGQQSSLTAPKAVSIPHLIPSDSLCFVTLWILEHRNRGWSSTWNGGVVCPRAFDMVADLGRGRRGRCPRSLLLALLPLMKRAAIQSLKRAVWSMQKHRRVVTVAPACTDWSSAGEDDKNSVKNDKWKKSTNVLNEEEEPLGNHRNQEKPGAPFEPYNALIIHWLNFLIFKTKKSILVFTCPFQFFSSFLATDARLSYMLECVVLNHFFFLSEKITIF